MEWFLCPPLLGGNCHAIVRVLGGSAIEGSVLVDLKLTADRALDDGVVAGILVTAREPSDEMLREARSVGEAEIDGRVYPRISIVSLEELFRRAERDWATFPLE